MTIVRSHEREAPEEQDGILNEDEEVLGLPVLVLEHEDFADTDEELLVYGDGVTLRKFGQQTWERTSLS